YEQMEDWVKVVDALRPDAKMAGLRSSCLSRGAGYLIDAGRASAASGYALKATLGNLQSIDLLAAARAHYVQGKLAMHNGDLGTALEAFERAVAVSETAGDLRSACENNVNLGYVYGELGAFEQAEP